MMIGKRGISHLELITAILIFIFAVVTIIYFINVQKGIETSEAVLDALEAELRDKTEIEIEKISLFVQGDADCFNISLHSDLKEENFTFISGAVAFNFSEDRLLINNVQQNFYEIYYFPENVTNDKRLGDIECELTEAYNYSIQYQGKIFSEKKLKNLDLSYKDYQIIYEDFTIGKVPPEQVEVQAREIPAEIIKENGEIIKTAISIKVW